MAGWMINCKEYAELASQSMEQPLSFWEKMSLKIHHVVCPPCKLVQDQFNTIRKTCRLSPADNDGEDADYQLSDEACERLKSAILEASKDKDR